MFLTSSMFRLIDERVDMRRGVGSWLSLVVMATVAAGVESVDGVGVSACGSTMVGVCVGKVQMPWSLALSGMCGID